MAHLSPRKPRQPSTTPTAAKSAHIEIYPVADYEFKGQLFPSGFVFAIISTKMLTSRKEVDNVLRFLSGLCANDLAKHPDWERPLFEAVPNGTQLGYLHPHHPSNISLWRDGDKTAPGAWVLQGAAPNMSTLLALLDVVFAHAFFHTDGWQPLPTHKVLQKTVNIPGRSWCEQLQLVLAPRGSFPLDCATLLANFAQSHEWLHIDGSLAHAQGAYADASFPFSMSTADEAEASLTARDQKVVHEAHAGALVAPEPPAFILGAPLLPSPVAQLPVVEHASSIPGLGSANSASVHMPPGTTSPACLLLPPVSLAPGLLSSTAPVPKPPAPHTTALALSVTAPASPTDVLVHQLPQAAPPSDTTAFTITSRANPFPAFAAQLADPTATTVPSGRRMNKKGPAATAVAATPMDSTTATANSTDRQAIATSLAKPAPPKCPQALAAPAETATPAISNLYASQTLPIAAVDQLSTIQGDLQRLQAPQEVSVSAGSVLANALAQCLSEIKTAAMNRFQDALPTLRANRDIAALQTEAQNLRSVNASALPDLKKFEHMLVSAPAWVAVAAEIQLLLTELEKAQASGKNLLAITWAFASEFKLQACWKLAFPLHANSPPIVPEEDQQIISKTLREQIQCGTDTYNIDVVVEALTAGIAKASGILEVQIAHLWEVEIPNEDKIVKHLAMQDLLAVHSKEHILRALAQCDGTHAKMDAIRNMLSTIQPAIPDSSFIEIVSLCEEFQAPQEVPPSKKLRVA